jgi:restriction system protein
MKSWVTQASRDDGVDGVAVNEDPVWAAYASFRPSGTARSYAASKAGVNALTRELAVEYAAKGIRVTTSWVGKASRDFAARNGRIEIIEGRQLKSMLLEHLGLDALISLPTLPPNWHRDDIS